jgi:two-component system alkaline phosphatase synthesis response regulator PhoP
MDRKKRILFVDDEPDIVRVMIFRLKQEGFEVTTAENGQQAIELAGKKPDLILLDILLPDIDGYQVCRTIKENPELKDIPVIFFTASASSREHLDAKAKNLGAQDVVVKPYVWEDLLTVIAKYIKKEAADG